MALYSQETIEQARAFDSATAPEKMRVHALAKALGIQSKDVIRELDAAGVPDKRAQSSVSAEDRVKVIAAVTGTGKKKAAKKAAKKSTRRAPKKKTDSLPDGSSATSTPSTGGSPVAEESVTERKPDATAEVAEAATAEAETGDAPVAGDTAPEQESPEDRGPKKAARKSAKKTTRRSGGKRSAAKKPEEATGSPVSTDSGETATEPAGEATEPKRSGNRTAAEQSEQTGAAPKARKRSRKKAAPKAGKTEKPAGSGSVDAAAAETTANEKGNRATQDTRDSAQVETEVIDAEVSEPRPPRVRTKRRTRRTVRRTVTSADGSTSTVRGTQEKFSDSDDDGSSVETEAAEIVETSVDAPVFMQPQSVEQAKGRGGRGGQSRDTSDQREAERDDDRSGARVADTESDVIDVEPTDVTVTRDDHDDREGRDGAENRDQGQPEDGDRQPRTRRRRRRGRGRGRSAESRDDRDDQGSRDGRQAPADQATESAEAPRENRDSRQSQGNKADKKLRNSRSDADVVEEKGDEDVVKRTEEPTAIKGSTRLEAQRRRRADLREQSKKRHVISEAEFLARRESVERTMVVRDRQRHDHSGTVTQVGVLEDDLLVEHMVTSETEESQIGNIYLGRVQNVLPSMEAAFIDIGHDRNGVLYSADVNWRALGPEGKSRRIERLLKSGDQVLVQVSKDPIGHKGPRLTTQISFAGRFLVYVPDGQSAGISRKLPEPERKRLKRILKEVTPEGAGTIVRTAAEGVDQEAIAGDIERLEKQWQDISARADEAKARKGAKPLALYEEPDLLVKVVRDIFNEDFSSLVVQGGDSWRTVKNYVDEVAPDLSDRLHRYLPKEHNGADVFDEYRVEEQIEKALDRKVWLPSGGSLIIDRTEAMTVIDVNTGKFTGSGGNLEETVTRNNLEAAEEIVRQMRLRDLGGMIVVDFIDMVLPENRDLVLRRLKEALGRDRTRHEVSEVTSLGLVQMTRKRLGTGLLETFSTECRTCRGTGYLIHEDPVEHEHELPRTKRSPRPHDRDDKPRKSDKPSPGDGSSSRPTDTSDGGSTADGADRADTSERNDRNEKREDGRHSTNEGNGGSRSSRRRRRRSNARRAADADQGGQRNREDRQPAADQTADQTSEDGSGEVWSEDDDFFVTESSAQREADERAEAEVLGVVDSIFVSDGDGDVDPIAAVVAAATAEAAEKDPDEPGDDRYVAQNGRIRGGRGQRGRRRVTQSDDRRNLPEETEQSPKTRKPRESRREKTAEQGASVSADATDGGSARDGRSYEDAVKEFESSPRRRRPTRGRSRSDHAPDPADYRAEPASGKKAAAAPEPVREAAAERKADPAQAGDAGETGKEHAPRGERTSSSANRRRRRVVRRVNQQSPVADAPSAETSTDAVDTGESAPSVKKDGPEKRTSGSGQRDTPRGNRSGRSRRRVVRKNG